MAPQFWSGLRVPLTVYGFHYDHALPLYGPERCNLLNTDTDSLCYRIRMEDLYRDISAHIEKYDTSNFPKDHPLYSTHNKSALGVMKDEFGGKPAVAFRGLRAKAHVTRTEEVCEMRVKGVPRRVKSSNARFEHYDKCVRENAVDNSQFVSLRSRRQEITTDLVRKEALSAFDDKRYLLRDGTHGTLAWGHKDIPPEAFEGTLVGGRKVVNTPSFPGDPPEEALPEVETFTKLSDLKERLGR